MSFDLNKHYTNNIELKRMTEHMYLKVETEPVPKRPRGRPRKYDNWFEFNYEYHKMMDNERKKRPDIRAKKSEYQRQYRQKKKNDRMLATIFQAWKQCV